jgi:hypothetical protein
MVQRIMPYPKLSARGGLGGDKLSVDLFEIFCIKTKAVNSC